MHSLYAEHAGAFLKHVDQKAAQQSIAHDAPQGVKQSVVENLVPAFDVLADESDGGYVGCQRAWLQGGEQAQQKGGDCRYGTVVEQGLQFVHIPLF